MLSVLALAVEVQVAIISTVGLIVIAVVPLLFQIRKSLKQNIGNANGEGNLVEMNIRALEQLGIVRYDVGVIKQEQESLRARVDEVKERDLAEAKRARTAIKEELTQVHSAITDHLHDHTQGRQWTIEVKPIPPDPDQGD